MDVIRHSPDNKQEAIPADVLRVHLAFPRNKLEIVQELGRGDFGSRVVLLAKAADIEEVSEVTLVAVKTLKGKYLLF